MEAGVIPKGKILSESNGQRWIVGNLMGVNGIAESYEAAPYDDKTPTDYPVILQIVPYGDEPWPTGFQFYLDHAKPNELDDWKRKRHARHLGIPVLLGADGLKINDQNYKFIVIERHGKDLWSLLLDRGKKFEAHTAYKITLQIINVLTYIHSKSYVHGDIKAWNIVVDVATQNHIYLMNGHSALYTVNDDQVDPNKTRHGGAVLLSRDAHMGDSTERGDMEMLFYNLVQLLGIELPWAKNFKNPSLVLKKKKDAFADVDKFLKDWSKKMTIPTPVCEYMQLMATIETDDEPIYRNFKDILENGLRKLYHLPYSNLEFSISSIPIVEQIEEDSNQVNKKQKKRKQQTTIPKLGCSIAVLANIISENCRHEGEVRLRDTGPGSLIEIICALTYKRKNNSEWQKRLANIWEKDTADLKTMTRRLWREKKLQTKGITSEAPSTENKHDMSIQDSAVTATASSLENTNVLNHSNPGTSNSQSPREAMSPDGIPPQEHTASFNLSNVSPLDVPQTPRSPSPFPWNGVQSFPIQPSTSGYSSHSSIQGDSHSEARTFSRTSEQSFDTEHSRTPEVAKVKRETGRTEEEVTECWMSESVGRESWQDKYKLLNTWLKMKEPYLDAFGSIPSEPSLVADRVQQVRVLLDEFRTQNLKLRQLKSFLAKLPSDSADALKLEQMELRWWNLQDRLEEIGRQLGEASLDQSLDALQNVSNSLDKLSLDNDPEEQQLRKLAILDEQVEDLQRTLLCSTSTVAEQLCQALNRQAFASGIRVKLRSVKTFYSNLQMKIRIKKVEVEKSRIDRQQFEELCEDTLDWLVKELENMEKLLVSTDRITLHQQQDYYKVRYQCVLGKETKVMEILERGRELTRPHNILDWIKSQWDRLMKQSCDVVNKLNVCAESCDKFYEEQDRFLCWLSEVEGKLKSVKPYSLDDISQQLKELYALQYEVLEKSGEFEDCTILGHTFIDACDEDENDVVKNKLINMKNRWDELNNGLLKRTQSLKDSERHLAEFHQSLSELTSKLERYDEELASHDNLEVRAKDLDRIKALEKEMAHLKIPLDAAQQQVHDLVQEFQELGIDADSLFKLVNRVAVHIEDSKAKLIKIREEILEHDRARAARETVENNSVQSNRDIKIERPRTPVEVITIESSDEDEDDVTATAAKQFYEKQDRFLRWLSEVESKFESVKPASLDEIGQQLKELSDLRNEINEKSSEFEECTMHGHTFIGTCDKDKNDIVKNKLIDMKHTWDKLNDGLLKRTQLLKDSERHLAEFHKSLSKLTSKLERYDDDLASHDNLEVGAKDLDRIKTLETEMTYLQRLLDAVHQQADDLVQEVQELGIDADSLFKLVNRVTVRIGNSKAKLVKTREEILEHTAAAAKQFYEKQELLLRWLSRAESKLESAKPASVDDIRKRLQELHELRNEVREKSGEFEQYSTLSRTLIGICDVNRDDDMKNELSAAKDRWAKLNHDLQSRLQSFEDIDKSFAVFNQSLLDLQQKIEPYEKESTLHDALEAAAKDTKLLHRLRELETEMTSLQKLLDDVRQQADGLVLKACEQGINVSHLFDIVNLAAARIENCKTKFSNTRIDIFKQEHVRLLKEIQADTPAESEDSGEGQSERKQDHDFESNNPKCNKMKSESPSRKRRSQSKDSVSSFSKSTKTGDGSKLHKNNKYDDSRPNTDFKPSKPKSSTYSKDANNSNRGSCFPIRDKPRLDTSHSHSRGTYYDRYRSPSTSSDQNRNWQKPYFPWRPEPWQGYRSNTFRNFDGYYRAQSASHYDSRFGWDYYHQRSGSPGRNHRNYFHQNRPFRHTNRENSGYRVVTSAPDATRGWESNAVKRRERPRQQDDVNANYVKSNEQLKKNEDLGIQPEIDLQKVSKPLVSYTCSDDDSDREGAVEIKEEAEKKPKYSRRSDKPNRLGVKFGYCWDDTDRCNEFKNTFFQGLGGIDKAIAQ